MSFPRPCFAVTLPQKRNVSNATNRIRPAKPVFIAMHASLTHRHVDVFGILATDTYVFTVDIGGGITLHMHQRSAFGYVYLILCLSP